MTTPAAPPGTEVDAELPQVPRPLGLRRFGLAILFAYFALVGVIALGTTALLSRDRSQELQRTHVELGSLARALDEHVTRSFERVDIALLAPGVPFQTGKMPAPALPLGSRTVQWLAQPPRPAAELPPVPPPQGADGGSGLATAPSVSDSEFQVGLPLRDRAGAAWLIPLRRVFQTASGEPGRETKAALPADHFRRFYEEVRITPEDAIAIFSRSGRLLARFPDADLQLGGDFSRHPLFSVPAEHATQIRTGPSPLDGHRRILVSRSLIDYPLVVQVSRPESVALRGFQVGAERVVWGACVLAGLLGILAWLAFEDVRRRELARRTLHRLARSLELRVRQRTAELETSNQELLAFSYSVSHDLRAPLRAINGFAHALTEDYSDQFDDTGRDYLARITRASLRMGILIDELLKLASVARQPLEVKRVNLSAMAEDILRDLRGASATREVETIVQPSMIADGDETLLRDVLGNLLDNAWKFTRDARPGRIEAGMEHRGDYLLFWVRDNGVGFDMNYAARLFQPFQQLHVGQGYAGTGIGLASARRIVERHGGKIWAESRMGGGTTIYFTLPHAVAVIRKRR